MLRRDAASRGPRRLVAPGALSGGPHERARAHVHRRTGGVHCACQDRRCARQPGAHHRRRVPGPVRRPRIRVSYARARHRQRARDRSRVGLQRSCRLRLERHRRHVRHGCCPRRRRRRVGRSQSQCHGRRRGGFPDPLRPRRRHRCNARHRRRPRHPRRYADPRAQRCRDGQRHRARDRRKLGRVGQRPYLYYYVPATKVSQFARLEFLVGEPNYAFALYAGVAPLAANGALVPAPRTRMRPRRTRSSRDSRATSRRSTCSSSTTRPSIISS